jgi:hypothetical protein
MEVNEELEQLVSMERFKKFFKQAGFFMVFF